MAIEVAIKQAIEYETRICKLYWDAHLQTRDKTAKRIYKLMAEEEAGHVKYLEYKLGIWHKSGELSANGLKTALPPNDAIKAAADKLTRDSERADSTRELGTLAKIYQAEQETNAFFHKLVEELPEEARDFFARFLEIENGHLALVGAEIDAINGMGRWFDIDEYDLEAG